MFCEKSMSIALMVLISGSVCHGESWPQFRGPDGLGVSNEKRLPTSWSDSQNLDWKAELPGFGASSPIVLGNRIYVTCYSGYGTVEGQSMNDLRLHLVCLDASDGTIAWDRHVSPKLPETETVRDHGYAGATPATDGQAIYVFFGKSGVFKFTLSGQQLWQCDVGSGTHKWGCGTSPVLFENLVIVNASVESGSLIAIDKATGREVWRAGGMNRSWNTPHLVTTDEGTTELVVSVKDFLFGFEPATGEKLWTCEGIHDYVCPSVISKKGIVYAIGGRQSRAIAVRAGGRGDVTQTHRLWEQPKAGANVSSPVIVGDHMYWVSDRNKVAYSLKLSDGSVVTQRRFPEQPYASAVAADGKIYIQTRWGGTFVLSAEPAFTQLAKNSLGDKSTFNASPVVANGRLYLRSDRYLYCIGG